MRGIMLRFGVLTLLLVLNCNIGIFAQSYGSTLGIRLGDDPVKRTAGLSFQYRFLKRATLEGILQSDFSYNTTFHGLVKQHHPIITKRVNLFVGTGISFGSEQSEVVNTLTKEITITYGNATFGFDVIAGVEFTFLKYNFSFDYKPNFNMVGREKWFLGQSGFSARYVILKGSEQNKRKRKKEREKRKEENGEKPLLNIFKKQ